MEFLSQDKYPDTRHVQKRIKKHRESLTKGGASVRQKTIEDFLILTGRDTAKNLYEIIRNEAAACGMKLWGNLTVYIGKVKREKCIECLAAALPFSEEDGERPEENTDETAWVSLQLSPEGKYLKYSLSRSTIIWAIGQMKCAGGKIAGINAVMPGSLHGRIRSGFYPICLRRVWERRERKLAVLCLKVRLAEN